jgi:DNA-binding transcriptional MerR regulator
MMKTKTKVEENQKKTENEERMKLIEEDQRNLNMDGYFRQQFLNTLERQTQAQEKTGLALKELVKLVESSDESEEPKTEEPEVPKPEPTEENAG